MAKKIKQVPIKIVAATSMTIFSLLAAFMGTIAWFNSVQAANNGSDGFAVYSGSPINIISCYAVRYDGHYGAIAYDISDNEQSIQMSEYDYIFQDRNTNTPLFIRMEITGFDTSKDLTVTVPCTGDYKDDPSDPDDPIKPLLSNVICGKFLYGLGSGGDLSVDDHSWSGDTAYDEHVLASYQGMLENAATVEGTPYVVNQNKVKSISLTLSAADVFDDDFILTKQDSKGEDIDVAVVFLALDYYVSGSTNLIREYVNSYREVEEERSHSFASDISSITLTNEGGAS